MSSIDYNVSVSRHDKDYWKCVRCPCSVTRVVALQYIQVRFRSGSVSSICIWSENSRPKIEAKDDEN